MSGVAGKSGRKSQSRAAKELKGTYRADQHNENEPAPEVFTEAPPCPSFLTGHARKAWERLAAELTATGMLANQDLHGLEAYCSSYGEWRLAKGQLRKYGMVHKGKDGAMVVSPYVKIAEDAKKQMRAWMNEFGITPSSRSRVKVEQKESSPSDEDWFNVRRN